MKEAPTVEELRQRWSDPEHIERVRRVMRMSPGERIQAMLKKQDEVLDVKMAEMRALHPDLSPLELCLLVHKELEQSEPIYYC